LEFIDTQRNIGTAMTALVNRLPGDTNPSNTTRPDPAICGFIGGKLYSSRYERERGERATVEEVPHQ
jgi:hypothetical protein